MSHDKGFDTEAAKAEKPIVPRWLWLTGFFALVIATIINVEAYLAAGSAERMGQWGDFFGGVFNPILSFLAFVGLLYTILLQHRELGLSREELRLTRNELANSANALNEQTASLKQQRFESAFFGMVGVLNQIIDNMDMTRGYDSEKEVLRGRDCFSKYIQELKESFGSVQNVKNEDGYFSLLWETGGKSIDFDDENAKIIASYHNLYKARKADLGHYFRVLYNIFKYIQSSEFSEGVYSKILRAQLSNQELVILFYNCFSEAGQKFKDVAIRFEIFDNLDVGQLIRPEHKSLIAAQAFGEVQ